MIGYVLMYLYKLPHQLATGGNICVFHNPRLCPSFTHSIIYQTLTRPFLVRGTVHFLTVEPWFWNLICFQGCSKSNLFKNLIIFVTWETHDWSYIYQHERGIGSRTEVWFNNRDIFFHEQLGQEYNCSRWETFENRGLTVYLKLFVNRSYPSL